MPILPAAPPQPIATAGGFDYVTVDSARRRVYAAHGGASQLLIVDADAGKVLGLLTVGHTHGVAVDPASGHVYTGESGDIAGANAVSEIDPVSMQEVHRVPVGGPVDAIAYDPGLHRVYADEDDGTRIFVIDVKTFKQIGTITLPGHKPEYIQINPRTHEVYQNIADASEIAVIDPTTLTVKRTIATPELQNNHPLQFDSGFDALWVMGENNKLSLYSTTGKLLYTINFPTNVDQCSLDESRHFFACGAGGQLTLVKYGGKAAPSIVAQTSIPKGVHTLAIDPASGKIWIVWNSTTGAFVQPFVYTP